MPALLSALLAANFDTYAPAPVSYQVSIGRAIRAWIAEQAAAGLFHMQGVGLKTASEILGHAEEGPTA